MTERRNSKSGGPKGLRARIRKFITSDDEDSEPRVRASAPNARARASTGTMPPPLNDIPSIDVLTPTSPPSKRLATSVSENRLAHSETLPGGAKSRDQNPSRSLSGSFDFDGKMDYYKSLTVQNIMREMSIKEDGAPGDTSLEPYSPQFSPKRSVSASKITVPLKEGETEHIADDADTLAGVAVKYEVSVPLLVKHNRMSSANILKGMRIIIPSEETIQHIQQSALKRKRLAKTAETKEATDADLAIPNLDNSRGIPDTAEESGVNSTSPKIVYTPEHDAKVSNRGTHMTAMDEYRDLKDITEGLAHTHTQAQALDSSTHTQEQTQTHTPTDLLSEGSPSHHLQPPTGPIAIRMGADDSTASSYADSESDEGSYRVVGGYGSVESTDYTHWERIQSEAKFGDLNRSARMFPCVYSTADNDHYGVLELGRYKGQSVGGSTVEDTDEETGQTEQRHTPSHSTRQTPHIQKEVHTNEGVGKDLSASGELGDYEEVEHECDKLRTLSLPELDAVVVSVGDTDSPQADGPETSGQDRRSETIEQDREPLTRSETCMEMELGEVCLLYHPFDYSWVKRDPVIILGMSTITGFSRRIGKTHVCAPSTLQLNADKYGFTDRRETSDERSMLVVRTRGSPPGRGTMKYNFDLHPDNATLMYDSLTAEWEKMLLRHPENSPGVALGDIKDGWDNDELFDIQTEMLGTSNLIDREGFEKLRKHLPEKVKYNDWVMLFDTSKCGHSMSALYRQVQGSGPNLLVMRDSGNAVFGAYFSEPLHVDERHYFGSGECFVFNLHPHARVYPWTGMGDMFISATLTCFSIGVGVDGVPALWLSEDLLHGSSDNTETFNNATLSSTKDFQCMGLEVWGFA